MEHEHTPKALLWEKWLNLLRSGTYEQGQALLKSIGSDGTPYYCCLGVVAEGVLGRQFVPKYEPAMLTFRGVGYIAPEDDSEYESESETCTTNLSHNDCAVLGLDKDVTQKDKEVLISLLGEDGGENYTRASICMWFNDTLEMSFVDIADTLKELGWDKDD